MYDIRVQAKGLISHGMSACAGCGLEIVFRTVLTALGEDTIVLIPPGCSAAFCGVGSEAAIKVPAFQGNLENTAAIAAGVRAGLSIQGNEHTTVLGFAGDGATLDIGLQALSGMMERGDRVIYVCYDNEAYMNTGIQGSSSTYEGATTTTTPGGKKVGSKDLMKIAMAHNVAYAASASVCDLNDLRKKAIKAKEANGPAVLHVHAPCPTGWGYAPAKTIEVARLAVETGAWVLYEYSEGKIKVNRKLKELKPMKDYFASQTRFKKVKAEELERIQTIAKAKYEELLAKE